MRNKLIYIKMLTDDVIGSANEYVGNIEKDGKFTYANYMNKDHGKYAIKRKITILRQELLNLERMILK